MGRGISGVKKNLFRAAAVAGIVILLAFAVGCSGDLLGYIKDMIEGEGYIGIELPKTGQTTSYGTRDDGDLQMGVAWPSPRFTDNGNGTITDNLTGLMWEQAPSGTARNWTNALITYANGLDLGGHNDWRLPNVNELQSLINAGEVDPGVWLYQQGFSTVQAGNYWSATSYAGGDIENPSYEAISTGTTGHIETVQITYDPEIISYKDLLDVFWRQIDPTDGGSFMDRGSQYLNAIFYHDKDQKKTAEASTRNLGSSGRYYRPIVTPVREFTNFYPAEDYHQDYYKNSPVRYKFYRINSGRDQYI